MKKEEKQHLKEDPLQIWLEEFVEKIKYHKKTILPIIYISLLVSSLIAGFFIYRSHKNKKDNMLFSKVMEINKSKNLSSGEKISALQKITPEGKLSSLANLYIAEIYFQEGELDSAVKFLNKFSAVDKKFKEKERFLRSEILSAQGNNKEAIKIINNLLKENPESGRNDYLLLRAAEIQIKLKKKNEAIGLLKKLKNNYFYSPFIQQADILLKSLES